jgi:hypothetical protein
LGSQNSINADQMRELGFDAKDGFFKPEWLPAGFEEPTASENGDAGERPQVRVLKLLVDE